jgi:hypothetical protein
MGVLGAVMVLTLAGSSSAARSSPRVGSEAAASAVRGTIAGRVSTSLPNLDGFCVSAYDATSGEFRTFAVTDARGRYAIGPLAAGSYLVRFNDCLRGLHVEEWYEDAADAAGATVVRVKNGVTPKVNARLAPRAIAGVVTDEATGAPIADVCVSVYDENLEWVAGGATGVDGRFILGIPLPGSYKVNLQHCSFPVVYAEEWYEDAAIAEEADLVEVTTGLVSGVDAALAVGGAVVGTVTEASSGAPLENACVEVDDGDGVTLQSVRTAADGSYRIGGLGTGTYYVYFQDCTDFGLAGEWWSDRADLGPEIFGSGAATTEGADPVEVVLGQDVTGIDAALSEQGITGVVTDEASGAPIAGCVVAVSSPVYFNGEYETFDGLGTQTDDAGRFAFTGLPVGPHFVQFECPGYAVEWYDDAASLAAATPIEVSRDALTEISATVAG